MKTLVAPSFGGIVRLDAPPQNWYFGPEKKRRQRRVKLGILLVTNKGRASSADDV